MRPWRHGPIARRSFARLLIDVPGATVSPMSVPVLEPWRPDLETYHRIGESGLLDDVRVELLDGVITEMSPPSRQHDEIIVHLNRVLVEATSLPLQVRCQTGLTLGEGWEPIPDFALVGPGTPRLYHPSTALWIAEIAVSSVAKDLRVKAPAYARAGVREYWVFEVDARRVRIHRDPAVDGYREMSTVSRGVVQTRAVPGVAIDLDAAWAVVPTD